MATFTLRKDERLKRKKQIERLFAAGNSFYIYPFKVFWLVSERDQPCPAQVLINVSRKSMKKAVHRNRIKRLIREVYRHQKVGLYEFLNENQKHILLGIIYTGHDIMSYDQIKEKINRVMMRLLQDIKKIRYYA
jgi:ribonuclease P protein component